MKVTVKDHYLNVRRSKPSVNAPVVRILAPGTEIETDGQLYKGDRFEGIDTWMKDPAGNYCWSGGVEKSTDTLSFVIQNLPPLVTPFDIPALIKFNGAISLSSQGAGGFVAVLDSGISNTSLQQRTVVEKNFVKNVPDARDTFGHGTKVAGIICGSEKVIKSFSSRCSIINYRVADQNGVVTSDPVYFALNELNNATQSIDVINLSFDVPSNLIPYIQPVIDNLLKKGAVTVVAAGNGNSLNRIAALQNVIKVGTVEDGNFYDVRKEGLNKVYDNVFINAPILSTSLNDGQDAVGHSSAYTAVVSSIICAFLRQAGNQVHGQQKLSAAVHFLSDHAFSFSRQELPEYFKLLKP